MQTEQDGVRHFTTADGQRWAMTASRTAAIPGVEYRHSVTHAGNPGVTAHLPSGERIGELGWNPESKKIGWVAVYDEEHRRHGIASGMLAKAREKDPEVHHGDLGDPEAFTDAGRSWAQARASLDTHFKWLENGSHEQRQAGKGKARRDPSGGSEDAAPPSAPRGQGVQELADGPGGREHGRTLPQAPRSLRTHPSFVKDLRRIGQGGDNIADRVFQKIDSLRADEPDPSTHPVPHDIGPGWLSTKVGPRHRIIHMIEDDGALHVGGIVRAHDYREMGRRLSTTESRPIDRELDEHLEQAFHPQRMEAEKAQHPRSGFMVDVGHDRVIEHSRLNGQPSPGHPFGEEGPAEFTVRDHGPSAGERHNMGMRPNIVGTEPIQHVYRGMGMHEYNQAQERGYISSDRRGTIHESEGTNAAADPRSAASYLPRGQHGMIVKIKTHPEHKWFTIKADGYLRSREKIPFSHVEHAEPYSKTISGRFYAGHPGPGLLEDDPKGIYARPPQFQPRAAVEHEVWYHGTRPEKVAHIREHGLATPPGVIHAAKWPMLTDSFEQAATYAQPGGKVLEYHIPKPLTDYRHPDALLWPKDEHDVYGQQAHAVAPKRPIPADYIAAEHDVPGEQRPHYTGALSPEARISVAEQVMERAGHAGRTWHVPALHRDDPGRVEAHRPVHDFVNQVLTEHGKPDHGIRVDPKNWHLREPGSGQAVTDGMNYIGIAGEHTNDLTLLHEMAHVIQGTHEGEGHDDGFIDTAHRLYHDYLGPKAAETFHQIVRPHTADKHGVPGGEADNCRCGLPIEWDPIDGWQHIDGSIGHDGEFSGKSVSDLVGTTPPKTAVEQHWDRSRVFWHGSPSGDLRGGAYGLHIGSQEAARQALHSRIGFRADGKDWDGTQEYGKTLLAGKKNLMARERGHYLLTGFNSGTRDRPFPEEDHYPHENPENAAKFADGSLVQPHHKPDLFPVRITGEMTNAPETAHPDFKANGYMKAQITRGTAKRGFFYRNEGEDSGSISAVVPGPGHVQRLDQRTATAKSDLLHRGVMVETDPHELIEAHDNGGMAAVHQHLIDQVTKPKPSWNNPHPESTGLGTHWTSRPEVAQQFAHGHYHHGPDAQPRIHVNGYGTEMHIPVVLHGHVDPEHHVTDPAELRNAMVEGHGWTGLTHRDERETLVRRDAPVHVTGIEASLPSHPGWIHDLIRHVEEDGQSPEDHPHHWQGIGGAGQHTAMADTMSLDELRTIPTEDYGVTVDKVRPAMRREWKGPDSLRGTWRDHGGPDGYIEHLTRQIAQHGISEPIEIGHRPDGTRTIYDGTHRALIAHEQGIDPVRVKNFRMVKGQHYGVRFTPEKRVFTHTDGLDHRLFDEHERLRPEVRAYVLQSITVWWMFHYRDWAKWARIYFAGSEASEWTSATLEGNNDFDVLIGVDYDGFRRANSMFAELTDQQITDRMNDQFRRHFNGPVNITIDGVPTGPWDRTTYVNPDSYDIRRIKPYAAYDVGKDAWVVKPPHLPHWSLSDLPRPVQHALRAADSYARAVLRLPEPERTQQGAALFQAWHSDRSRAFSDRGEGWYDIANLREKWLDQSGLWAELVNCAHRAGEGLDLAPADWSNMPPGYVASRTIATEEPDWHHEPDENFEFEDLGSGDAPRSQAMGIRHKVKGRIGAVEYQSMKRQVRIWHIDSHHAHSGAATRLMDELVRRYPSHKFDPINLSDTGGQEFWDRYKASRPGFKSTGGRPSNWNINPKTRDAQSEIEHARKQKNTADRGEADPEYEDALQASREDAHHEYDQAQLAMWLAQRPNPPREAGTRGELPGDLSYEHRLGEMGGIGSYGQAQTLIARHPSMPFNGYEHHVGHISWYTGDGEIAGIEVHPDWQRRGIATELLSRAREIQPNVHHAPPNGRTNEGNAWARKVGNYADYVREHSRPERAEERANNYTPGHAQAYPQHHPGDRWPNVGWVKTDRLLPYREHTGDQHRSSPEAVEALADSFRHGEGFVDPLRLEYHAGEHKALLGEGNHRLEAAQRAGLSHVPVMVHPMYESRVKHAKPAQWPQRAYSTEGMGDQIHPGNVLPISWLHDKDKQAKYRELMEKRSLLHEAVKAHDIYGKGELHHLFPVDEDGPARTTSAPWPIAGRRRDVHDYDPKIVGHAIQHPHQYPPEEIDPRDLRATQPSIVRAGVQHYLGEEYERHQRTFADQHNPGNERPVIYRREDGQNLILSGHHRAAAALLRGEPLQAVVLSGPFGPPRGGSAR